MIADEYALASKEYTAKAEEEVRIMESVKGNTNIVDYADHVVVDWEEDGMCLFIPMIFWPLLALLSLVNFLRNSPLSSTSTSVGRLLT